MKKIQIFLISIILFIFTISINFFTPIVNADTEASIYGFNMTETGTENAVVVGWKKNQRQDFYHDDKLIGTLTTYIGVYKSSLISLDNHSFYIVLIKQIMTPTSSEGVYGFSDDCIASSYLTTYKSGYNLVSYSPDTQETRTNYSVHASFGRNMSVSATAYLDAPHKQYIYNDSSTPNNYFCFECDYYIATGLPCDKSYVKRETAHYSMFAIEDYNNETHFKLSVNSYGRFAYAGSSNYFTCVRNNVDFYTKNYYYLLDF